MRMQLLAAISMSLATPAMGAITMLFDFGNDELTTPDVGWNNVTYDSPNPAPSVQPVVDSTGTEVAGVSLTVTDQFFINGPPSTLGTESPSGDASGYPVEATDDYFFGHTGAFAGAEDNQTGGVALSGLNPSLGYSFTFFSSRTGINDMRETAYAVSGANSGSGVLEAADNNSNVLRIDDIFPDGSGEIFVEVSAGPGNTNVNGFYYINVMQVDAVPEPAAIALLAPAALFVAAVWRRRRENTC